MQYERVTFGDDIGQEVGYGLQLTHKQPRASVGQATWLCCSKE